MKKATKKKLTTVAFGTLIGTLVLLVIPFWIGITITDSSILLFIAAIVTGIVLGGLIDVYTLIVASDFFAVLAATLVSFLVLGVYSTGTIAGTDIIVQLMVSFTFWNFISYLVIDFVLVWLVSTIAFATKEKVRAM